MMILIVEDDVALREIYEEALLLRGYGVIHAGSAEDGVGKIARHHPQLVILDMGLGGRTSGRDILLYLKKHKISSPVIVVSGKSGMAGDPEIALCANVRRFFVKPVPLEDLLAEVGKAVTLPGPENPPVTRALRPGDTLAGCLLEEIVGSGASGVVYRGQRLGEKVAVKILPAAEMLEEDTVRFEREVRGLATVKHPNIVELLDTGYAPDGSPFLVMRYFPGQTIQEILRQEGRLAATEAVAIARQAALGMAAVHATGMIHRDLKSSNILYRRDTGQVKLIDFGIARRLQVDSRVTRTQSVIGTPEYMSPEQCQGLPLDKSCDIYSLGATLYYMLTGSMPFERENIFEILIAQIGDPLEWPVEQEIALPLIQIVEKMMAKDPTDRFAGMGEVVEILESVQSVCSFE